MPFPNEHSARLRDPNDFSEKTFRRVDGGTIFGSVTVPKSIAIIWAKLKGSDSPSDNPLPQALRFNISNWTAEQAKQWLKNNELDDNVILFEPAEPEMKEAGHLKKREEEKKKRKMREAGHLDDGESTLVGFEITTSRDEGHTHTATLDETGTGTTSPGPKDEHVHGVKNFEVLASSGDETEEHTHQIAKRKEVIKETAQDPVSPENAAKSHMSRMIAFRALRAQGRFAASVLRDQPEASLFASMLECHSKWDAGAKDSAIDSYAALLSECERRDIELDLDPECELNSYFLEAKGSFS